MSTHRSPRRRSPSPGNRHRADVRPRYGRIATLGSSVAVTLVAVLGATGALPSAADDEPPRAAVTVAEETGPSGTSDATPSAPASTPAATPSPAETEPADEPTDEPASAGTDQLVPIGPEGDSALSLALPADSGTGRRVVFSESAQRVWLVGADETVQRTYLVSGSIYENLEPGTFEVYSRSEDAIGIDDSGTMKYFVRFTQGTSGAAIGFHDIPIDDGGPIQTVAQLGTPLSHGCIRQKRTDAIALWDFAPEGTTVVVTA